MSRYILFIISGIAVVSSLMAIISPLSEPVNAASFNPGRIIDDSIFTNTSMSESQIQAFLNNMNSTCLKDYRTQEPLGGGRYGGRVSAARAIWRVSQEHRINPQVILATLEKEQGLVTRKDCPAWRYQTALGYGCPDTAPCSTFGFSVQLWQGARHFRGFFDRSPGWIVPYTPGTRFVAYNPNANCGGKNVVIQNRATASLYSYTPYQPNSATLAAAPGQVVPCGAYGNINFWRYFNQWFGSTTTIYTPKSNMSLPSGPYRIDHAASGRVLDVRGGKSTNGTPTQLYTSNGTAAQKWSVERTAKNYYKFRNLGTGKYLDVRNASTKAGANIQIWSGNGTCAQEWALVKNRGVISILNKCSGLALDTRGGKTANGTPIQTWDANNTSAQQWILKSLSPAPIKTGFYEIESIAGLAFDATNGSIESGTPIQLWKKNNSAAQQWQVTRGVDGLYSIYHPLSRKYLDTSTPNAAPGSNVYIMPKSEACTQKWIISKTGNQHSLQSSCSETALDVRGGGVAVQGAKLQAWESNGSGAQRFVFNPLQSIPRGVYSIATPADKVIDVIGGYTANGRKIQLWNNNGSGAQQWELVPGGGGTYYIKNAISGRNLDITNASVRARTPIQIWDANTTCAQRWRIIPRSVGSYDITSACSSKFALDVTNGRINVSGTRVQLFNANGSGSQAWTFKGP